MGNFCRYDKIKVNTTSMLMGLALFSLLIFLFILMFLSGSNTSFSTNSCPEDSIANITEGSSSVTNNKYYSPREKVIKPSADICWRNNDATIHTVTSGNSTDGFDAKFDSNAILPGQVWPSPFEFKEFGSYDYYCKIHPYMQARIIVD